MKKRLFKAKKIEDGQFVEGYGISYSQLPNHIEACYLEKLGDKANDWVAVYPSTISISVGLKDMENRLMFENDMIETEDSRVRGVLKYGSYKKNISTCDLEYDNQGFYIDWIADDVNNWNEWLRRDICFWKDKIKVIGSQYDEIGMN